MADSNVILPIESQRDIPVVRAIGLADLRDALIKGIDDFRAMPTHAIFLCLIYPIVGVILFGATFGYDIVPLLYPLAAGFALIGPFAAIGLYELSRRRELGLDTSWKHAFDIIHSPSIWAIVGVGSLLLVIFANWLGVAHAIYVANFGEDPIVLGVFIRRLFTTPEGQRLIVLGNVVGFLFAVVAFVLSVVSFPLLLDRHVSAPVAMFTSVRAVLANPLTMTFWGILVAGLLVLGSLPFFFGLAVVMPVLGHATWHLYRKVINPDPRHRPEFRPPPKGHRYGADLPVSLFVPSKKTNDDR
jgi:uncharacterized membrane protein